MAWRLAKSTSRRLAFVFPVALFVLFVHPVPAQTLDATYLRQLVNLDMKWLAQAGDNPAYASPDFDDSHWMAFDPSSSIETLFSHHPDVVWYRLHVKVDASGRRTISRWSQ